MSGKTVTDENKMYAYWLSMIPTIGNVTIQKLLQHIGNPKDIFFTEDEKLNQELTNIQMTELLKSRNCEVVEHNYVDLEKKGIRFISLCDEEYPNRLRRIQDAPFGLFVKGTLPEDDSPTVAIIGSRACSEYGKRSAEYFGRSLAECGVQVISGMAYGIDCISQKATCSAGGKSFAVLGNGVDICYPSDNMDLYERLIQSGGVLSEYQPGTEPKPQLFPARNRIISGLSDIILVVEAKCRSGTYITVTQALEQGKEVYAVPGRINDALSKGCNYLISQGAGMALTYEDIIEELKNYQYHKWKYGVTHEDGGMISYTTGKVPGFLGTFLDITPKSFNEIWKAYSDKTKISISELTVELIQLQIEGKVKEIGGGYFLT